MRTRRWLLSASAALLLVAGGCEDTGPRDGKKSDLKPNLFLSDANNYRATGTLAIPTVETASGADIDICWPNVTADLKCHAVAADTEIDSLALIRLLLTEEEVEGRLGGPGILMSETAGYLSYRPDDGVTCAKLSDLTLFGSSVDIRAQYVERSDMTYMLLLATGTQIGVGGRTMMFLKPTASSANTAVDAPSGCGLLDFSADLGQLLPLAVPQDGPWVLGWQGVTKDGQGNAALLAKIDGLVLGFYEGQTVPQIQSKILDIEIIATNLWDLALQRGATTADLSQAKERTSGVTFGGFQRSAPGTWLLGLTCSTCQNPAPVVLTVLQPAGGAGA